MQEYDHHLLFADSRYLLYFSSQAQYGDCSTGYLFSTSDGLWEYFDVARAAITGTIVGQSVLLGINKSMDMVKSGQLRHKARLEISKTISG